MISAGSCMSRPRDNSYRNDGAHHATGEVVQDQRAPGAPFSACNQRPGTVTRDRPATLALRAMERPLTGRFAGPGISGPAQRGVATGRRGKCRSPGLDGALRKIAATPLGPWLLVAVALGLVIFGVYSCCEARWRKVRPG
jgi:hypothetical protein